MSRTDTNFLKSRGVGPAQAAIIALSALVWILEQPTRTHRLLDLTGLSPQELRARAGDPVLQAAILNFLGNHEPDLIACAAAIGHDPAELIQARDLLES
jgi:hypothetical protein